MKITNEKYYLAVDPGLHGALGVVSNEKIPNAIVIDTPVKKKVSGKGKKAKSSNKEEFDIEAMVAALKPYVGKAEKVVLEAVSAMPGNGNVSMFRFGEGFGIWEGVIVALGFRLELVTPQSWKKEYGTELMRDSPEKPDDLDITKAEYRKMKAEDKKKHDDIKQKYESDKRKAKEKAKDAARALATKLFPNVSEQLKLKKNDGRAESLLIAERARRMDLEDRNG